MNSLSIGRPTHILQVHLAINGGGAYIIVGVKRHG